MPDIPRTRSEKCGLERRYNDFKAGRPIVRDGVRDFILDSWLRCRKSFPKQEAPRLHFVQGRELEDRILRNGFILKNAAPIMQSVFDLLTGPDVGIKGVECCVFIADKGYVLLKSLNSGSFPIKEGFVFDEELIGTNSVYSCILNRYIATVYGLEHYFGAFAGYVASSSPIITEDGTVHGAFGVLLHCDDYDLSIKAMSDISAKAVSSLVNADIHKSHREFLLDHIDDAIIYTDHERRILSFNRLAAESFKDIAEMTDVLECIPFPRDFRQRFLDRKDIANFYTTLKSPSRKGTSFYVTVKYDHLNGSAIILHRAKKIRELAAQVATSGAVYRFEDILGDSPELQKTIRLARKAASGEMTTLITGESGTGKELFAHAIHNESARAGKPFLIVNCGALPQSLIQSELFGYEEGTFTGASVRGKVGKFELADGGTLFLDEVGELPLDVQANLLRFLQCGEISKIGASQPHRVNVRVIAATNRDLRQLAGQGRFREDLFYRLNAFPLRIPALRERGDDALLLARLFARKFSVAAKGRPLPLTEDAAAHLAAYGWPGNVRELENCIQLHVNLAEGDAINIPPLAPEHQEATVPIEGFSTQKNVFEKKLIAEALERYGGNVKKTASFLHVPLSTLYNKIKRYNLFPQRLKAPEPTDTHEQDKELGMLVSRLSPQSKESLRLFLKTLV